MPLQPLQNIRIVLIGTTHPGNIGAAARAMKVMGLERLYLVNPKYFPNVKATAMASGAADVLDAAVACKRLDEAIADCGLLMGTSARPRGIRWPELTVREAAGRLLDESIQSPCTQVAVLFGTESTGLSNDELQHCHYRIEIPANPAYPSLNLAQAVQVVCYELRMAAQSAERGERAAVPEDNGLLPANQQSVDNMLERAEDMLWKLDFLNPRQPRMMLQRLRRMTMRARPERREVSILQGIITAILRRLDKPGR